MLEVSKLLDDPSTSTSVLGTMIGKDQGLATKILSIANSPLYGLPRKVSTIDFAILIIGYQDIKNIVIALSMIESFKNKTDENLDQREFWLHSIITGNAAKRISDDLGYRISGEVFVAGLLHDLGIPVIHKYFRDNFVEVIRKMEEDGVSEIDAEVEELGYSHQELGRILAEKWNLPSHLCSAIEKHHVPGEVDDDDIVTAIVHLADYMTQKLQVGNFYLDNNFQLDESILETLKFESVEALDDFLEQYNELFEQEVNSINYV